MLTPNYDENSRSKSVGCLKVLGWLLAAFLVLGICSGLSSVAAELTAPGGNSARSVSSQSAEPELTQGQLRARSTTVTFEDLARYPENYDGKLVHVYGEVIQTMERETTTALRVNITQGEYGWWGDPVYVSWQNDAGVVPKAAGRVLEDDIVNIYGRALGLTSYEAINGATITLPLIQALDVSLEEDASSTQQEDE